MPEKKTNGAREKAVVSILLCKHVFTATRSCDCSKSYARDNITAVGGGVLSGVRLKECWKKLVREDVT
jgi:hypothetical protein